MPQTRDQVRASIVLDLVGRLVDRPKELKDAYGARCHQLPVMVRTNGLAQALSFFIAKARGSSETARAYGHLHEHLQMALVGLGLLEETKTLWQHACSPDLDSREYLELTRECLALSVWFKRFAVSVLDVDPDAGR